MAALVRISSAVVEVSWPSGIDGVARSISSSKPGVERARSNLWSSLEPARQYSGIRYLMFFAPTVTGQLMLAADKPPFTAASQRVGAFRSSAYQYQPCRFVNWGSKVALFRMP